MIRVDVRSDMRRVTAQFKAAAEAATGTATLRALNRAATTVRANAAREISREYNIKVGAARRRFSIRRATRAQLIAEVIARARPLPLIEFSARQTRRGGVTVRIKRSGTKRFREAFIATMASGHRGVFFRERRGGDRARRLPIEEVFSLSIPQAFAARAISRAIERLSRETFIKNYEQQLRYLTRPR